MQFTTTSYFTHCLICYKQIDRYYTDFNCNRLCEYCLVKQYNGHFPMGCGVYLPCLKCMPPNIKWYYESTYDETKEDCGDHYELNISSLYDE